MACDSSLPSLRHKVLVVDDDPAQRRSCERALGARYEVVSASDGAGALEAIAQHDFTAIVSDLVMPGIDGLALHRSLFQSRPDLLGRLLFVTRGSVSGRHRTFTRRVANPVLMKPVSAAVLLGWIDALAAGKTVFELHEAHAHLSL
jgi:CheY-like chemotaxis protein